MEIKIKIQKEQRPATFTVQELCLFTNGKRVYVCSFTSVSLNLMLWEIVHHKTQDKYKFG